jgi:HSP20 family molecular chaperone IbpA
MLMRFDPFSELDYLAERLHSGRWTLSMPLDAYRVGDFFHVDFDLPGVTAKSIDSPWKRTSSPSRPSAIGSPRPSRR